MPYIGKASAAGQRALQSPLIGVALLLRIGAEEVLEFADRSRACHLNDAHVFGFVLAAVGDAQLASSLAAGLDHALAVLRGGGHRLLTEDVLARLRGAYCEFRVHAVGQD